MKSSEIILYTTAQGDVKDDERLNPNNAITTKAQRLLCP